ITPIPRTGTECPAPRAINGVVGREEILEALEHAPPGIFDKRSWAYWNLMVGRVPAPPMPVRREVQPPMER
ncbi:MAG: hypothetical protein ACREV5_18900, partial [Steroidobacter sp.]